MCQTTNKSSNCKSWSQAPTVLSTPGASIRAMRHMCLWRPGTGTARRTMNWDRLLFRYLTLCTLFGAIQFLQTPTYIEDQTRPCVWGKKQKIFWSSTKLQITNPKTQTVSGLRTPPRMLQIQFHSSSGTSQNQWGKKHIFLRQNQFHSSLLGSSWIPILDGYSYIHLDPNFEEIQHTIG